MNKAPTKQSCAASVDANHHVESHGGSCQSYQAMSFVIPFLAVTLAGIFCKSQSVLIAPTIGLLAGGSGFLLYRSIKLILRKARATMADCNQAAGFAKRWQ